MEQIERRRLKILQRIAAAGQYISSQEIATAMKISAKTVRRDIELLIKQMAQSDIEIQKKPGQGYFMPQSSVARFQRLGVKAIETEQIPAQRQRTHYLTRRLLAAGDYIKSVDLADELFVSQTTISAELRPVRKLLDGYGLSLENVPSRGLKIQGPEQYIRSCMIYEYCCGQSFEQEPYTVTAFHAFFAVAGMDVDDIYEIVKHVLVNQEKKPYFVAQNHMKKIALAILLAVNRGHGQYHLRFSNKELYESKMLRSYQAACEIFRSVSDTYSVEFEDVDCVYLANLVLGYRTFLRFDEVSVKENFYRAMDYSTDAIMQLYTRYGVKEFLYDRELKERVALYLLSMEARMVTHMLLENIISREMSRSFILAREFATYVCAIMEKNYHCILHHSEIDRLAMVFLPSIPKLKLYIRNNCSIAVASQNYSRDIAASIAQRHLNCYDGLVRQVIAYESYQQEDVIRSQCDVLLTDIPPEQFSGFPGAILYYSFSLSKEDSATVENWYYGKDIAWAQLKTFFHPELYFSNCRATEKKDVIELVSKRLDASGYVDAAIYQDLERNSRRRFTVTNNGIGFVKTLYTYGGWSFCAVFQFPKPVFWGELQLQTLFVLGTGTTEPTDFLLYNGWMEALLQDERCPLSTGESLSFDQLMEILHTYFLNH